MPSTTSGRASNRPTACNEFLAFALVSSIAAAAVFFADATEGAATEVAEGAACAGLADGTAAAHAEEDADVELHAVIASDVAVEPLPGDGFADAVAVPTLPDTKMS